MRRWGSVTPFLVDGECFSVVSCCPFSVFDPFSPFVSPLSYINQTGIECRYGKCCRMGADLALAFRNAVFG